MGDVRGIWYQKNFHDRMSLHPCSFTNVSTPTVIQFGKIRAVEPLFIVNMNISWWRREYNYPKNSKNEKEKELVGVPVLKSYLLKNCPATPLPQDVLCHRSLGKVRAFLSQKG